MIPVLFKAFSVERKFEGSCALLMAYGGGAWHGACDESIARICRAKKKVFRRPSPSPELNGV
jgi:hypothetical protein